MRETTVEPIVRGDEGGLAEQVWRNAAEDPDAVQFDPARPGPPVVAGPPLRRRPAAGDLPSVPRPGAGGRPRLRRRRDRAGASRGRGLLSRTRYEWTLVDYAFWAIGAVTVPIYETSSAEQIVDPRRLRRGGCVVETGRHAARSTGCGRSCPRCARPGDRRRRPHQLAARGRAVDAAGVERAARGDRRRHRHDRLHQRHHRPPKGCMLTHRNISADAATPSRSCRNCCIRGRRRCCSCRWRTRSPG